MTPKLILPLWLVNLVLVSLGDTTGAVAVGFVLGQGVTLFFLTWWMRRVDNGLQAERTERKAWTDALLRSHESATALIRAADMRGLIELKPPSSDKEIA